MGNRFQRVPRVEFIVKDMSNGRTFSHLALMPAEYTLSTLKEQIEVKLTIKKLFILKYKNQLLPIDDKPNQTLCQTLSLNATGTNERLGLILEYIDNPVYMLGDPWTIYIRTLVGRAIEVMVSNPQDLCVLGLKLLIHEASGLKPNQMRLVIDNKELNDGTLDAPSYIKDVPSICNGCTIYIVLKNR